MSNEMIERVDKALALKHWPDDSRYLNYIGAAKAAIEAMREPTDEMMLEACTAVGHADNVKFQLKTYQAMIDAALNEKT